MLNGYFAKIAICLFIIFLLACFKALFSTTSDYIKADSRKSELNKSK